MTDLPITVYSPDSPLRHPVQLIKTMFRDLVASRGLAWRLFVRDRNAQFRQSMLGYVWAFVPPLVASLPFVFLNSQGVVSIQGTAIPYAAYAMIGTIIWQIFVDSLTSPLKTTIAAKPMLTRINFPREAIILSGLGLVLFNVLIRMILLVGVFLWFHLALPSTVFLVPIGILALMAVGFMAGVLLTPLGLLYSDVQQTIPVLTMCLMFLTPVLYPAPKAGIAAKLAIWNPLSPLVVVTRNWLTTGSSDHIEAFILVSVGSMILLFIGWIIFRLALPHIIARSGN